MSATPPLDVWLGLAGVLAAGTAAAVVAAALAAHLLRAASWRRTVWQVATVAMLILVAVEVTGVGFGVA
ncbi:MAG: hypothetical protein AMS14_10925 [Planctomycetes bacterium DG_20]|nr:MAG: hypothetical protein AMS14_10925 [Planctomycetes bacterium DG_20]